MIALAQLVDPDARALRKTYEDEVDAVVKKNERADRARPASRCTAGAPTPTRRSRSASPTAR